MGITGAALVALGIICISRPLSAVLSLAWIIGILAIVSGIATLLNWINLRAFFPQSGSILLYHANAKDVRCLRTLIPALQEAGYTLCTVSGLLGLDTPESWLVAEGE